ncbi:helix-turn-helix domain-containing protein [bacterium]|jgi:HTH-type transcriptional regulator / antitoxin HigA|nr:helix-turn-helix domain-containing protein [bacterium]
MKIRPIRSESDYKRVMKRIDLIIDAEPGTDEFDELEVFSILAEDYEERNHEIRAPNPIEALKNIMEWKGLTRKDLEPYIGTRARVSEVLNGKRNLTITMIMKLRSSLGIPADILLPETNEDSSVA